MAANILANRDTNTQLKANPSPEKANDKLKSLEYHRQVLESRLKGGEQ